MLKFLKKHSWLYYQLMKISSIIKEDNVFQLYLTELSIVFFIEDI